MYKILLIISEIHLKYLYFSLTKYQKTTVNVVTVGTLTIFNDKMTVINIYVQYPVPNGDIKW